MVWIRDGKKWWVRDGVGLYAEMVKKLEGRIMGFGNRMNVLGMREGGLKKDYEVFSIDGWLLLWVKVGNIVGLKYMERRRKNKFLIDIDLIVI